MNLVNKHKLPAMEAIKYDNQSCLLLDSLWNALYSFFNTTLHCQIDINILDEIRSKQVSTWVPFSKEEFKIALGSCNNLLTPGPDKCYDLKLKRLSNKTTLVLSNTRELDRVPSTKYSTLYTNPHGPC